MIFTHTGAMVGVSLLLIVCFAAGQARGSGHDPATQGAHTRPSQGLVDFTLSRINRSEEDYGECFERGRTLVLHESIQNGLFWSNVVALSLLACLSVIVVYQHQHGVRREWTVAEVLQQYENALSRANARVDSATKRNHELTEALTSARETPLRSSMISLEHREPTVPTSREKRAAETQPVAVTTANAVPSSAAAKITADGSGSRLGNQMGLFKPEVDLVLKVNSLEQQLGRSQEHEKHLRRQLTQADQRLQAEQQKNRTLKGD